MNKVITINLNGNAFQLEEAGYSKLQDYLRTASEHLADDPDKAEILSDIEQAIADKCHKFLNAQKSVISDKEVEDIIKEMGPVNPSGDKYENEETERNNSVRHKKLFRNPDDSILGGVASGIAAYLGLETVFVRLFFVVISFFGGYGILFYIILWLIVPEAKSNADKINMRGEKVNLASLEKTVKEKVQELKVNKSGVVKNAASITVILGNIIRWSLKIAFVLFKALMRVIGFVLFIAFAIAIIGLTIALVAMALGVNSQYLDFPLQGIITGWEYYLSLFTAYFLVFVPFLCLMLIGQSIFLFKNSFNKSISLGLLAVWLVSLIFGGALALQLVPEIRTELADNPQFKTISRNYDIKDFQSISVEDANSVSIVQGKEYLVLASGRENDLNRLNIENKDGILKINSRERFGVCIFCLHKKTEIRVAIPDLKSLNASGASRIVADDIAGTNMDIKLSGASRATLVTRLSSVSGELSGASRLELQGLANTMTLNLSGAGRFLGENFEVKDVAVTASGASHANVNATKTLDVKMSGASRVNYWGEPKVESQLSGSSHISPMIQHYISPSPSATP